MNSLDKHFHIQQLRMSRRHGRRISGQQAVARIVFPGVLCSDDPASAIERLTDWEQKQFARRIARADEDRMSNCVARVQQRFEQGEAA